MSIREIAKDLYRLKQEVERLENLLAEAPLDKRLGFETQLRKAKHEYDYLKRALDGRVGR